MQKRRRWWRRLVLWVLPTVVLGACTTASPGTEVVVTVTDKSYTPTTLTVPAGEPVNLTLKNTDTREHQWGIKQIALLTSGSGMGGMSGTMDQMAEPLHLHIVAAAGAQTTLEFTPVQPNQYEFFCPMPGHTERGILIVKGL